MNFQKIKDLSKEFLQLNNTNKVLAIIGVFVVCSYIFLVIYLVVYMAGSGIHNLFKSTETKVRDCYYEFAYNPYDDGTGHHAGWEWSYDNKVSVCGGKSKSFIEGCEASLEARTNLEACLDNL